MNLEDCVRIRNTAPQSQLSTKERELNVKAAFAVRRKLEYRHVAIVDDVITTGYTVAELSSQLLKAGVKRVDVWACARAVK
ncbi:MAG: ComF family protein [Nitrososphaera sp.]